MVLTYKAVKKDKQIFFEPFFLDNPVYEKFSEINRGAERDTELSNGGTVQSSTSSNTFYSRHYKYPKRRKYTKDSVKGH